MSTIREQVLSDGKVEAKMTVAKMRALLAHFNSDAIVTVLGVSHGLPLDLTGQWTREPSSQDNPNPPVFLHVTLVGLSDDVPPEQEIPHCRDTLGQGGRLFRCKLPEGHREAHESPEGERWRTPVAEPMIMSPEGGREDGGGLPNTPNQADSGACEPSGFLPPSASARPLATLLPRAASFPSAEAFECHAEYADSRLSTDVARLLRDAARLRRAYDDLTTPTTKA